MNRLIGKVGSTVVGQAVWAAAQAAIVIVLSSRGEHALIGVYTLGLAVFAPLCLLGSLNLRTSVALGRDNMVFAPRQALALRAGVVIVALLVTLAVLTAAAGGFAQWLIAATLISIRAVDQISDVSTGFYQRNDRQDLIARSFFIRGATNFLPFVATVVLTGDVLLATLLALAATLVAALAHDALPMLRKGGAVAGRLWQEIRDIARRSAWVAFYPVLDNLHFNSFRYAMFLATSAEFMGLVGVAQTLFVPFQLVVTALGFQFLPQALRLHHGDLKDGGSRENAHLWKGVGLGFAVTVSFAVLVWLMPSSLIGWIFQEGAQEARPALMVVAIAMLPVAATGFVALSLIAREERRLYVLAPTVALVVFWISAVVAWTVSLPTLQRPHSMTASLIVAILFAVSTLLRLAIGLIGGFGFARSRQQQEV